MSSDKTSVLCYWFTYLLVYKYSYKWVIIILYWHNWRVWNVLENYYSLDSNYYKCKSSLERWDLINESILVSPLLWFLWTLSTNSILFTKYRCLLTIVRHILWSISHLVISRVSVTLQDKPYAIKPGICFEFLNQSKIKYKRLFSKID